MNQGMLILLLSVLSGGAGNTYGKGSGGNQALKAGMGNIKPISTRHMVRQMHQAIDALQRVEQISRLADFSTIRKKEREGYGGKGEHHDHKDGYIGNIREAFGNISDLLGGAGDAGKRDEAEELHRQEEYRHEERPVHESNYADAQAGRNESSGGMSPEALISLVGNLIGNMNADNGGNQNNDSINNNGNEKGNTNDNYSGNRNNSGNGLDIDKIMKMVGLISSLNNVNRH